MIVGIDEVGRGPLAGPVTVCAVMCSQELYRKLQRSTSLPPAGKDSKKLSADERERYAAILATHANTGTFAYAVVHISNTIIDTEGISTAIKKAMHRCLKKLGCDPRQSQVLLDGGLKAPQEFKNQKTIIKGDERERIIAWASILAKVSRDTLMRRADKKFPAYGFAAHKGYGTAQHRQVIQQKGLSTFHRKTFCGRIAQNI